MNDDVYLILDGNQLYLVPYRSERHHLTTRHTRQEAAARVLRWVGEAYRKAFLQAYADEVDFDSAVWFFRGLAESAKRLGLGLPAHIEQKHAELLAKEKDRKLRKLLAKRERLDQKIAKLQEGK